MGNAKLGRLCSNDDSSKCELGNKHQRGDGTEWEKKEGGQRPRAQGTFAEAIGLPLKKTKQTGLGNGEVRRKLM